MSINTELQKLKDTKAGIRSAILDRGVKVGNEAYSLYPDRIRAITTTAGTYDNFLKGLLEGSITDLVIPDGTTRIRSNLFMNNTTIETLYVPSSVDRIDMMAFWGCTSLTSVEFEEGITVIGSDAFRNCTSLTSVAIPESVEVFDGFNGCSSLTEITFLSLTPPELGQYSLDGTNNCPIYVPKNSVNAYKTARYWTRYASRIQAIVGNELFNSIVDRSVTEIDIPTGTTSIGDEAFINCSSLTDVTIPNTVTSIGYAAFYQCTSLTAIDIPDSVTSIGDYAFHYCTSLNDVTIGSGVTSIGALAFYIGNAQNRTYTIYATTPPTLLPYDSDGGTYYYNLGHDVAAIYVPAASVEAYKTAANWTYYASVIQAIP